MAQETERLLTEKQAAEVLNVHFTTLSAWRCKKRYNLPFVRLGGARAIRYKMSDLLSFIEKGLVADGGEAAPAPKKGDRVAL
jgi:hypothetical protein